MIRLPFWATCVLCLGGYMIFDMHQKLVPESQPFVQMIGFVGAIALVLYWIYQGCCLLYDKLYTIKED